MSSCRATNAKASERMTLDAGTWGVLFFTCLALCVAIVGEK